MKSIKSLAMLITLAVVAAPAMAYARPTINAGHAHTLTAHDHTEQAHTRTIPAHQTH
jgi:hypothetical protein